MGKIRRTLFIATFFVLIIVTFVLADTLSSDLNNFLKNRTSTPEEDASQDNLAIEIQPEGQEKPNIFTLSRITVWKFSDYLFSERKFDELIKFCNASLKASPDFFTYYILAEAYEINGEIDNSIETYKKTIEISPGIPLTYFRLWGIYAFDKNDVANAQKYLNDFNARLSVAQKDTVSSAQQGLITSLLNSGNYCLNVSHKFDNAAKYFRMILKLDPNYESAKLNLALCQFHKSVGLKDREGFEKAVEEIRIIGEKTQDKKLSDYTKQFMERVKQIRKEEFGG